jgi:hypothetical protein
VAVERGHDGGRFVGNVDQNRGGRAAILAVIDAGEGTQSASTIRSWCCRADTGNRRSYFSCGVRGHAARQKGPAAYPSPSFPTLEDL